MMYSNKGTFINRFIVYLTYGNAVLGVGQSEQLHYESIPSHCEELLALEGNVLSWVDVFEIGCLKLIYGLSYHKIRVIIYQYIYIWLI